MRSAFARVAPPAWLYCLPLLLVAAHAGAEADSHMPPRFAHLTDRDGLSQVSVWTILQDRQGFLWFG